MGNSLFRRLFAKKEVRILIMGLDAAGKTTSLYSLKLGEVITTIPTIGFNVETLNFKNLTMSTWDVGGRDKVRSLYRHYFPGTEGVVFVLDSNDKDRLEEALQELYDTVKENNLPDVPVLVLANKQDLEGALKPDDIAVKIQEEKCMLGKRWKVFGVVATNQKNSGLYEAFNWLADEIVATEKNKLASNLTQEAGAEAKNSNAENHDENNSKSFYTSFVESLKNMLK